jgi:PEP-CTERM motif
MSRLCVLRWVGVLTALLVASFGEVVYAGPVTWNLLGVTFADGGTATGSFTFDTTLNHYTNWSVVTSTVGGFTGFSYTTATSTADPCCTDELKLTSNDTTRVFTLDFNNAGNNLQSPQNTSGSERVSGVARFESAGQIVLPGQTTTTPEPSSWMLLAAGALGLLGRRFLIGTGRVT